MSKCWGKGVVVLTIYTLPPYNVEGKMKMHDNYMTEDSIQYCETKCLHQLLESVKVQRRSTFEVKLVVRI